MLAVEHADGSASAALRPGGEWMLYQGLGNEEAQVGGWCTMRGPCRAARCLQS